MRYFDLHCDTLTECAGYGLSLERNGLHIDLERARRLGTYVQCFAVWLHDSVRGEEAFQGFCQAADLLERQASGSGGALRLCRRREDLAAVESQGGVGAVLTVENGSVLGGKLERVQVLKDRGVAMLTLTWNGENELGRGVMAPGDGGLTPFGRQVVPALEQAGILVDVSHASPELFWDVMALAKKPVVASHSNAKAVCGHPRNLTDEQFTAIRDAGGLVGLNFYKGFLNDRPEQAAMEDVLRHAEHFLSLGGEDTLAMGSDFDGAALPADMPGLEAVPQLYELFLRRNYPQALLEKLFYGNAARMFAREGLL